MLYVGQPITANCNKVYLCTVKEPIRDNFAIVEVIAIAKSDDTLALLEEPYLKDWFVNIGEDDIDRANRLYSKYLEMTGKSLLSDYTKEEIDRYSIMGRMM